MVKGCFLVYKNNIILNYIIRIIKYFLFDRDWSLMVIKVNDERF